MVLVFSFQSQFEVQCCVPRKLALYCEGCWRGEPGWAVSLTCVEYACANVQAPPCVVLQQVCKHVDV